MLSAEPSVPPTPPRRKAQSHEQGQIPEQGRSGVTARQAAVLEAALGLLVAGGERALTTAGVARAANCSKESLYKWFGDRDGMLAAMVEHQASKVRVALQAGAPLAADTFAATLVDFARDLLSVLAGDVSLALNRLAIGQAGHGGEGGSRLGALLLARGRRAIGQRAGELLEAGRRAGLIAYGDRDAAFQALYGLIVRDLHVRLLLGEAPPAHDLDFDHAARRAVDQFLHLHDPRNGAADPANRAEA